MNKTFSKYIAPLNYFENILLVLSAASGGASIASFAIAIRVQVRIPRASLGLVLFMNNEIAKKL